MATYILFNRFKFSNLSAIPFACIIAAYCGYDNGGCGNGNCDQINRKIICSCDPDPNPDEYNTIAFGKFA